MKKSLSILLTLILTFISMKAESAVLSDKEVKANIEKQVLNHYKQYTNADLEVKVVAVPFKDVVVPDGKISYQVTPSADRFMPRDLNKVSILVDGRVIKNFNAPTITKAYQNVLVASCVIEREKAINSNVVKIEKKEISNNFEYALGEDSLRKDIVAKKYFSTGEILDKRFVKIKPDILRNAVVTVLFNANNLTVSTEATALSDGALGDNICIMNKNYNKIYKGTVIGENKVLVKI